MSTLDNYGEFDLPEEKSEIEINEDPVNTILALYDYFEKQVVKKIINQNRLNYSRKDDELYSKLEKLFEGRENLNPDGKKLLDILKQKIIFTSWNYCGYYNGSLLNK